VWLIGPRFIHVFPLVLPSHKSLTHESGGVKVVVKGICPVSVTLVETIVVLMVAAVLASLAIATTNALRRIEERTGDVKSEDPVWIEIELSG
jgi:cytochrome c oxidase assembly factor CtaG